MATTTTNEPMTYSLQEVRCGTGWRRGVRFMDVADANRPRTYWAAYSSVARYGCNAITLHRTEREALEAIAEGNEVSFNDPDDPQQVRSDEELREALYDVDGLEWYVDEVKTP